MEEKEEIPEHLEPSPENQNQVPQGWRGYIGLGTVTLGLSAVYSFSQGAILAPIIFSLGAIMLMPTVTQAPLKDGTKAGCGIRFVFWFIFFAIGLICLPSQKPTTPATSATPTSKPAEIKKTKPTSTPTTKPTPKSTPIPQPTEAGEKEPLVNKPFKHWATASKQDRMITASILTYNVFKDKTQDKRLLATAAEQLFDCLNAMKTDTIAESPVSDVAVLCAMGLGWANDE